MVLSITSAFALFYVWSLWVEIPLFSSFLQSENYLFLVSCQSFSSLICHSQTCSKKKDHFLIVSFALDALSLNTEIPGSLCLVFDLNFCFWSVMKSKDVNSIGSTFLINFVSLRYLECSFLKSQLERCPPRADATSKFFKQPSHL